MLRRAPPRACIWDCRRWMKPSPLGPQWSHGIGIAARTVWRRSYCKRRHRFFLLNLLNSSACAHISIALGLNGPIAAYSPFADAGISALIDGVFAVSEGECPHAIIGAVSPKHDSLLPIQHRHWAESIKVHDVVPSEASAFLQASYAVSNSRNVALLGYARGRLPMTHDADQAVNII